MIWIDDPFQGRKKHEDANGDHDCCESKNAATDIIRHHLLAREDLTDRVSEESAVIGTHPAILDWKKQCSRIWKQQGSWDQTRDCSKILILARDQECRGEQDQTALKCQILIWCTAF